MSKRARILLSWVGHADLLSWAKTLPEGARQRKAVQELTEKEVQKVKDSGRVRSAIGALEFDEVHLVSEFDRGLVGGFAKWLGGEVRPKVKTHPVKVEARDYEGVFNAANEVLKAIYEKHGSGAPELWIALSSGTNAMAATLVLLGKSRYPARFLQTFKRSAREVQIPFDLTVDYIPEFLRDPDASLQALADHGPSDVPGFDGIKGDSKRIRLAVGKAQRFAVRDVSVLILGESGTGKELFAGAIHAASKRKAGPLEVINCALIPPDLQASTLFGHVKGAFTGADHDKEGLFHAANGGTLFLDEFGELDLQTQASLLRVLQPRAGDPPSRRRFRRLQGSKEEISDVRIIAATNRNPQEQIRRGELREDLFYRVATLVLDLPPLRSMQKDIGPIAEHLLGGINTTFGGSESGSVGSEPGYQHKHLSRPGLQFLARHTWPGNVRQLHNILVHAAVLTDGETIGKPDLEAVMMELPAGPRDGEIFGPPLAEGFSLPDHVRETERHYLRQAYADSEGKKTRAAQILGLNSYQAIDAKLKSIGLEWSEDDMR